MVLRQLLDPAFQDDVQALYNEYRELFAFYSPSNGRRLCYAAANRDEFLAECLTIYRNLKTKAEDYEKCGLSKSEELQEKMPKVYELMEKYFNPEIATT